MNEDIPLEEIVLLTDKNWSIIDAEVCRVIDFTPLVPFKNGKIFSHLTMPYASIAIECKKINKKIKGFITHKLDFIHLWMAFKERTIKENEEVIIFWSIRNYKYKLLRFFPGLFPKLWVMICPKGAFELMTNPNHKPELGGEARFLAERPIVEWKPEIMK